MSELITLESNDAPNSSRPISNLKTLITKKLMRTASELPMNKSLTGFSATIPSTKFINLRRASNDTDNFPGPASQVQTQNDEVSKSPVNTRLKKTMSSTMGNFSKRQRSSTASPDSPLVTNSKSSSPNKRRTFTSAIRINPAIRPLTREARPSSRWTPLRGSPLVGSPTNNKSNNKDESVSFAVMKVQEIITDCCRLTQGQNSPGGQAKNKGKEDEVEEKSARAFDFWKKDQTFLEERAKMRAELQKVKDASQVKNTKKGPSFLDMDNEDNNKHEDEEEVVQKKEPNENGKVAFEQNDDMTKFILQKPRTFYVKTLPASVRKTLRLMQGPAQPVPTEEDKPIEKPESEPPKLVVLVPQKIESSPGIKEVSIDLEKTQSTEKKFKSNSKDKANESGLMKTEEPERVSSPVIVRRTTELHRQASSKSFEKSPVKGDHSRNIEVLIKKQTDKLGETIAKWNEKVEISPKQKVSFLAYKRGDYRKRVVAVHQMYKSATFLKTFTQ